MSINIDVSNLEKVVSRLKGIKVKNGKVKMPVGTARRFPELSIAFKNVPEAQIARDLLDANELAIEYTITALSTSLDAAMNAAVWTWRDGGNRDIVDTGALRDSLNIIRNGTNLSISYGLPYAALVHYGGYIIPYGDPKNKPVYVPPRPWLQSTIFGGGPVPQFDFEKIYARAIKDIFG